jgi:uncharacterized protein (DUF305 family)
MFVLTSCAGKNLRSYVPSPQAPQYERDFLQNRIAHQLAAIDMARACTQKAQRDELKQFCGALVKTEEAESNQLQAWLGEWYGMSPKAGAPERMTEGYRNFMGSVRSATGTEFENAFLSALRLHHHEGVRESRECQAQGVHAELRLRCAVLAEDQEREIRQMNLWICEWLKDCIER